MQGRLLTGPHRRYATLTRSVLEGSAPFRGARPSTSQESYTAKSAWFMAHRLRQAWNTQPENRFKGPVEPDETYMGGKRKNMSKARRKKITGSGPVGKTAVVAMKDRLSNEVRTKVVPNTKAETLRGFVLDNTEPEAKIYTDEALAYKALPNREAVRHANFEYVRGQVHTDGVKSFWSLLKRAHVGTFRKLSRRHLDRYVAEFAGRHNMRDKDTLAQISEIASRMVGKRLRYRELVG